MFVLLHTYRVRHGCRTIRQMIARWAPPSENATDNYIRAVAQRTGLNPDRPLDTRSAAEMIPVVAAMSAVENGVPARDEEVLEGWELYVKHPA